MWKKDSLWVDDTWYNVKSQHEGVYVHLCNVFIFRRRKLRYPTGAQCSVYEPRVKGYDGTLSDERDCMKSAEPTAIPHYLSNWNKHSTPYISSPTLLTGNNVVCESDSIGKLPYRDRSLSVGNNEFEHLDPVSATYATDAKPDCEYKTRISWHYTRPYKSIYHILCCH